MRSISRSSRFEPFLRIERNSRKTVNRIQELTSEPSFSPQSQQDGNKDLDTPDSPTLGKRGVTFSNVGCGDIVFSLIGPFLYCFNSDNVRVHRYS